MGDEGDGSGRIEIAIGAFAQAEWNVDVKASSFRIHLIPSSEVEDFRFQGFEEDRYSSDKASRISLASWTLSLLFCIRFQYS